MIKLWAEVTSKWRRLFAWLEERRFTAKAVAFGSFGLGVLLAIWPREIANSLAQFVQHPLSGAVYVPGAVFWVAALAWTFALNYRLSADYREEDERVQAIRRAITRAPNPRIFNSAVTQYGRAFDLTLTALRVSAKHAGAGPPSQSQAAEMVRAMDQAFGKLLDLFAKMAAEFNGRIEESEYGANVMILVQRAEMAPYFSAPLASYLRFHDPKNLGSLAAVLYLPPALAKLNSAAPKDSLETGFALPVPDVKGDERRRVLVLPGAPLCVDRYRSNIFRDTRHTGKLEETLVAQDANIRRDVLEYFSDRGRGAFVRSFASFPVVGASSTLEDQVVGVLNIDCASPHLLGPDDEALTTFEALVAPMLRQLMPAVIEYAKLLVLSQNPVMLTA